MSRRIIANDEKKVNVYVLKVDVAIRYADAAAVPNTRRSPFPKRPTTNNFSKTGAPAYITFGENCRPSRINYFATVSTVVVSVSARRFRKVIENNRNVSAGSERGRGPRAISAGVRYDMPRKRRVIYSRVPTAPSSGTIIKAFRRGRSPNEYFKTPFSASVSSHNPTPPTRSFLNNIRSNSRVSFVPQSRSNTATS